jgi:mannose-6-phosphate isomerase-like protein (cupin superfamily)
MNTMETTLETAAKMQMPGVVFNVLLPAAATNNAICIAEFEAVPGFEPFRHVHTLEDEIFIVKEGSATFFIGDEIREAVAGDLIYLPVNVPHHFETTSPVLKGLLIITPGNLENFFRELSQPYNGNGIPQAGIPSPEQITYMLAVSEKYGMYAV